MQVPMAEPVETLDSALPVTTAVPLVMVQPLPQLPVVVPVVVLRVAAEALMETAYAPRPKNITADYF